MAVQNNIAKDLQDVNLVTKMDVYAVISISGDLKNCGQKLKTAVDRGCGTNPTWNFDARFDVDESLAANDRLTLKVKLVCDRSLGDKAIGEVNVSVKELLDSPAVGDGQPGKRFVSYQVVKPSGNGGGVLNFSYRFVENSIAWGPPPPLAPPPVPEHVVPYAGTGHLYAPYPEYAYPAPSGEFGYTNIAAALYVYSNSAVDYRPPTYLKQDYRILSYDPYSGPPPPPPEYNGGPGYGYPYNC